jgi:CRP-like cAMP-binding protein
VSLFTFNKIEDLLPEVIKTDEKGTLSLNYNLLTKIMNNQIIVDSQTRYKKYEPSFIYLSPSIQKPKSKTIKFKYNLLLKLSELKAGSGFGELALINRTKRNATIATEEDSHFAILEKDDFDKIMGLMMRK